MTRLNPASKETLSEFADSFALVEGAMGFVPNSMKVMALNPEILKGFQALSFAVLGPFTEISQELKSMVSHVVSAAAGCRYCQAHTGHTSERNGVPPEKIKALWSYETSELFNEAERAALSLAQAAGIVPNQATDAHFDELKKHYSEKQCSEILAVISLFGFLNRWNDTLGTDLEDSPLSFAETHLSEVGWEGGNHV